MAEFEHITAEEFEADLQAYGTDDHPKFEVGTRFKRYLLLTCTLLKHVEELKAEAEGLNELSESLIYSQHQAQADADKYVHFLNNVHQQLSQQKLNEQLQSLLLDIEDMIGITHGNKTPTTESDN